MHCLCAEAGCRKSHLVDSLKVYLNNGSRLQPIIGLHQHRPTESMLSSTCVCVCLSAVFPHCRPCFFFGPFRPGQHRRVLDGGRALLGSAVPVRGVRAATRQSRRAEPHHGQPAQIQLHRTCGGGRIRLWISYRLSGTTSCIEGLFFFAPSESSSSPPSVRMEGWR